MRKILAFLAAVIFTSGLYSQTPQKMSYQAVIRNSSGELVTNKMIGMQISILQGSVTGTVVYTETQTPATNDNGLVSVEIGGGSGFDDIDWAAGPYFIKIETDPLGGTNYTIEGTSQLLSVPYALHAKTAESISGGISETDPVFGVSPASGILHSNIINWDQAFVWGNHASAGYLKSFTETDPIFGTSPANAITLSNISDWTSAYTWGNHAAAGYLKSFTETDPVFAAAPAKNISVTNITNWNTAYSWGDHSTAGYLKSFTETDPVFTAAPAKNITGTNITNWNTAYSWGDHATAGYLKSFTENDPEVGSNTSGFSPKWDGSALVTGVVYQDATGKVGVGTVSPTEKLEVSGNILSTSGIIYSGAFGAISSTGSGNSTSIKAGRAGGGLGAALQSSGGGLNGGNISIEAGAANHFAKGGDIILTAGDAFDTGSQGGNVLIKSGGYTNWMPGYIAFFTPGSYPFGLGNPVEKMRIAGNGYIGIGTLVPTTTLEVNGIITATAGNSTNWNTAYSWGDHATAGYLKNEVDGSVTNELQSLSLSNDSIYLSNGGVVKLPPSNSWSLNGNAGTVDGTNFIGTSDNAPLNIKVNNQKAGRIDSNGPTFFGYQAGKVDNGISNTGFGYQALSSNSTGPSNAAIGAGALQNNTTGGWNAAGGSQSLQSNTTGGWNNANGTQSMMSNTTGNWNNANGTAALRSNTTGSNNTATGSNTLWSNIAGSNGTAIGYNAMLNAYNGTTPFINYNIAVGYEALKGSANPAANTGNFNSAFGYQVLNKNTTGSSNTSLGIWSMAENTTGNNNVAIGYDALLYNSSGNENTASGDRSLHFNTSGSYNTADGVHSLLHNTTGNYNTGMGYDAGSNNSAGSYNVFLGYQAGYNETGSNKLYIANSSVNPPLIYGDFATGNVGLGTTTPKFKLESNGSVFITGFTPSSPSGKGVEILYHTDVDRGIINSYDYGISSFKPMEFGASSFSFNQGSVGIGTISPAAKLDVNGDMIVRGNFYAPGTVVQTIIKTSEAASNLNVTSFTEANTDYRISIIPKYENSIILVEYNFSINTAMTATTVFHMQMVRDIGISDVLVGTGPVNGLRNRTSFVSRPSNGQDANDLQNVYIVAKDSGLTVGTTYTYGFKYRREPGGSGTCYFNASYGDASTYGFSGIMTMKATEIAQ